MGLKVVLGRRPSGGVLPPREHVGDAIPRASSGVEERQEPHQFRGLRLVVVPVRPLGAERPYGALG